MEPIIIKSDVITCYRIPKNIPDIVTSAGLDPQSGKWVADYYKKREGYYVKAGVHDTREKAEAHAYALFMSHVWD